MDYEENFPFYNGETILSCIRHYAKETPDKVCITEASSSRQIKYSEFWKEILNFSQSIESGRRFIMQTRQTIAHLVAFYGVQAAGSIAIPVEAQTSAEKLEELALEFDACIMKPMQEIFRDNGSLEVIAQKKSAGEWLQPDPESIACIILTTGTTGKNKGVLSSFRCRYCGADNVRYSYEITPEDVALVPQVLSHSGGLRRVEAMFVSGSSVVIMGAVMMFGEVFGAIKKYNCSILQIVPAQASQILARAKKLLAESASYLRIVSVGSAVISEHDKEELRELLPGVRLFNDYGSTEAIGSAYFEWSAFPPKKSCVGYESLHSKIVFLDDEGNEISGSSRENPGIIATKGAALMSGYDNEPELTAEVLKGGCVISSDLGYRGGDGMVYVLGRRDDIIVSGANKISPSEIEDIVGEMNGVRECCVIPKPDRVMGQMPVLFLVWEKENHTKLEVIDFLSERLDKFKIPRSENIYTIKRLPRTDGTGKIKRNELKERLSRNGNI